MANVSIFVVHKGCPNKCSFCDQRHITGVLNLPDANFVKRTIENALAYLNNGAKDAEIAFFGGSFTAIDREYMLTLLNATKNYVHLFKGIRVSTRPDAINEEILEILKEYKVTSIELGAQSMCDDVLLANERGHKAKDVISSANLIKQYGFSLGLQMMTGLYKSSYSSDIYTADSFIKLKPDTVRIYPTVVLKNTTLEKYFYEGIYSPPDYLQSIDLCKELILKFEDAGINIIRVGLHFSETLVENIVSGAFHPAFRELCENSIFYDNITKAIIDSHLSEKEISVYVAPGALSKALGHKSSNKNKLINDGFCPLFFEDSSLIGRQVVVKKG